MEIIITSLEEHLTNPESSRYKLIQKNKELYPQIQTIKSINGFNKEEVIAALKDSNLKLLNIHFKTFGTLACFLTKVMVWKKQIEEQIPYVCLLEDDLELNSNFLPFILSRLFILEDEKVNILRCADWGECYITSLESAKRLIKLLERNGILANIDEQLWSSGEFVINSSRGGGISGVHNEENWINGHYEHVGFKNNIFKLHVRTNEGDIRHTDPLPENISETLFLATPSDIKPSEIQSIIQFTKTNKNFLAFGLNGMALYLLKHLDETQSLTTYEYGPPFGNFNEFKKKNNIPDSRFIIHDLCKDNNGDINHKLIESLNKSYGGFIEEYHPQIMFELYSKINYKQYDVFIINGFARGFLIWLIKKFANKGSIILLNNSDRDWYDWALQDQTDSFEIEGTLFKLITV